MGNIILNKGGAGVSLSRPETIKRLEPITRALSRLNLYYQAASEKLSHEDVASAVRGLLRVGRMDVGKLSESVLSAGGAPYNATDLEPPNFVLEGSDSEMLNALQEKENEFQQLVREESSVRHQIRTQAILMNVETNSQERLNYLSTALRSIGQTV